MTKVILIIAALILLAGILVLINPEIILGYLRKHYYRISVHILAVAVRLAVGVLLVLESDNSKFPNVVEVLGWLFIFAALSLAVIGRQNFKKLLSWALNTMKRFSRIGGVFAALFGGFLFYAFV